MTKDTQATKTSVKRGRTIKERIERVFKHVGEDAQATLPLEATNALEQTYEGMDAKKRKIYQIEHDDVINAIIYANMMEILRKDYDCASVSFRDSLFVAENPDLGIGIDLYKFNFKAAAEIADFDFDTDEMIIRYVFKVRDSYINTTDVEHCRLTDRSDNLVDTVSATLRAPFEKSKFEELGDLTEHFMHDSKRFVGAVMDVVRAQQVRILSTKAHAL